MPFLLVLLVVASGLVQPIQIAANNRLRDAAQSSGVSALIGFLVGGILLTILILSGLIERGELRGLARAPWWAWVGGAFAVFAAVVGIVALPHLSAASLIAAAILGQLVASTVIDHFGWLNVPVVPINKSRIFGAVLLFIGALLMRRT
jgi:transporter family-2 protein